MFWRGAVHQWTSTLQSEAPDVRLCAYEEPIRQFLLGAAPPPDDVALWVLVCPNGSVLNAMLVPWNAPLPDCSRYFFYLSGLCFVLHFAYKLPQAYRTTCAYHSPDKIVWVSTEFEGVIRQILRTEVATRDDSRLEKTLKEITKNRSQP